MTMRALLTCTLLVAALPACSRDSTAPGGAANAALAADNVVYGSTHTITKDGVRASELRSDSAYVYDADRRLDLHGVNLTFYGESGQLTGTLTSTAGEYNTGTGAFIARGNVVLTTQEPEGTRRVETEELHYDVQGDELRSDVDFTMTRGGSVTRGTSFRSDTSFERWEVTNARTEGGIPQPREPTGTGPGTGTENRPARRGAVSF